MLPFRVSNESSGPGQFDMPNSVAVDSRGNVYVADLGNRRIQVFDNDGNFKSETAGPGAPWALCISPGAHQYLYSSNSNPPDSRSEEHTSELQSLRHLVCRLLLEKKKTSTTYTRPSAARRCRLHNSKPLTNE